MHDNCRKVVTDLHVFLDGECAREVERAIAEHLAECPPCLHRADFERAVRHLVATRCVDVAPPDLANRVIARLHLR